MRGQNTSKQGSAGATEIPVGVSAASDLAAADGCAAAVFEAVPLVMRAVKGEIDARRAVDLSMQQFRALKFIERHEGVHLSRLTEHVGATLSAVSRLVDGLVDRGLLDREVSEDDRRRVKLRLTPLGERTIAEVHAVAVGTLERILQPLSQTEKSLIMLAMNTLRTTLERHITARADSQTSSHTGGSIA